MITGDVCADASLERFWRSIHKEGRGIYEEMVFRAHGPAGGLDPMTSLFLHVLIEQEKELHRLRSEATPPIQIND